MIKRKGVNGQILQDGRKFNHHNVPKLKGELVLQDMFNP